MMVSNSKSKDAGNTLETRRATQPATVLGEIFLPLRISRLDEAPPNALVGVRLWVRPILSDLSQGRKTHDRPAYINYFISFFRKLGHMSSNALSKLVKTGNAKKFHRAIQQHEEEHGELPSLEMVS